VQHQHPSRGSWTADRADPELSSGRPHVGRDNRRNRNRDSPYQAAFAEPTCAPASASRRASSLLWSSEVFSTTPPVPLIASRTLSVVILRISRKRAAPPGSRL